MQSLTKIVIIVSTKLRIDHCLDRCVGNSNIFTNIYNKPYKILKGFPEIHLSLAASVNNIHLSTLYT